jgi:inosine-uridine nucleoside N-ribohydrolase
VAKQCVIFCDNTSPDNLALVLAATRPESLLDVKAVIVTGRAAHYDRRANINQRDDLHSELVHLLNTKRMAGFLARAGRTVPVFMGRHVRDTELRTVIPHDFHVDEHHYDTHDDEHRTEIAGDFAAALKLLYQLPSDLMLLIGGPLTEVAHIIENYPVIAAKFGQMVVQAGDFGEDSNVIGGKGNSFNGACDARALHVTLSKHPGAITLLSSNITKQTDIGFARPEDIARLGIYVELAGIYAIHYEYTARRRGTRLFIHDLGLVMLAEQLIKGNLTYPYRFQPVKITAVPYTRPEQGDDQRGTIIVEELSSSGNPERNRVVWQYAADYYRRVKHLLHG